MTAPPRVSSRHLLRVWLLLSVQSFGGGGATLALMQRAVVNENGWVTDAEFAHDWAICQVAPGINLIAITVLLGKRIAGWRGIGLCLVGMLLPSVAITVLMTALYSRVRELAVVKQAVSAIIPASVGLGLATALAITRPPLEESRREGSVLFALGFVIIVASAVAVLVYHIAAIYVLLAGGTVSAAASWANAAYRARRAIPPPHGKAAPPP